MTRHRHDRGHQRNTCLRNGCRVGFEAVLLVSGLFCLAGCPPAPSAQIPPAKLLVVPVDGARSATRSPDAPQGAENTALPVVFPGLEEDAGTDNDGSSSENSPIGPESQKSVPDAGITPVDGNTNEQ